MSAAAIPISAPGFDNGGAVWSTAAFATTHPLPSGQSFNLQLTTAADSEYTVFVMRKGGGEGFDARTYFADGVAQFTTGSGWSAFACSEGDLQFFLGATPP